MANSPNLTLPVTVPEMEQYHQTVEKVLPFALYSLFEIDEATLEDYRCRGATDRDDDTVKLPPQARFAGQSLQSIVDYHVQLGHGGEFDPTYFLVCVYPNSTSLLAVTLDDDDLECKPDQLWIKVEDSGLLLVNLQITNTDWFEAKEGGLEGPTFPDDGKDDDDENHPSGDTDGNEKDDDDQQPGKDQDSKSEDYGTPPPLGFHIQVYVVPEIDKDALVTKLEPASRLKKQDRSDWVCKLYELPKESLRNPTRYAADIHPTQCSKHATLESKYFIVADEPNFDEEGVAIVHIDWDGKTKGRTQDQLIDFGKSLLMYTQRAEVSETGSRAAVGTVCMLAQNYLKWTPKVKQFAIYYANTSDADINLARAIDSRWVKRGHGEARVAPGGSMMPDEIEKGGGFWPALIRRHVAFCKRQRFVPSFVREYFAYCGDKTSTVASEVQLVKLEWNGDLSTVDSLANEYEDRATAVETLASKTHGMLTTYANGEEDWPGERLTRT